MDKNLGTGDIIFISVMSVLVCLSVFANILVILVVLRNKKMHNVTNMLIVNLAISDISFAGLSIPQSIHDISHNEDYYEGTFACKLVNFLPVFCITNASYTLVLLSWERYRAIVQSLQKQLGQTACKRLIFATWILSTVVGIPTLYEYEPVSVWNRSINETWLVCTADGTVSRNFLIFDAAFILFFSYLMPLVVMVRNYTGVIVFLISRNTRVENSTARALSLSAVRKRRVKVVKMLVTVAAIFTTVWLPFFVLLFEAKVTGKADSSMSDSVWSEIRLTLAVFSTCYNAVLYVIFNSSFRRGFKNMLCGTCSKWLRGNSAQTEVTAFSVSGSYNSRPAARE